MREGAPFLAKQRKEPNFAQERERFAYHTSSWRRRSVRSPRAQEGKSSPAPDGCRTPYKMGSTRPEAGAPPEAGRPTVGVHRGWMESMRLPAPPSSLSRFLTFCAVDHEGWAPPVCSFFPFLSTPPLPLLTSPRSCCFLSLFGHSGSPGGDVCTHLPHMAMPTPPHPSCLCSCFGLFTVLNLFYKCSLDCICWPGL